MKNKTSKEISDDMDKSRPSFPHSFNLGKSDEKRLQVLRKQGVKIVDIIRSGIDSFDSGK